jgi:hypothetical protein
MLKIFMEQISKCLRISLGRSLDEPGCFFVIYGFDDLSLIKRYRIKQSYKI